MTRILKILLWCVLALLLSILIAPMPAFHTPLSTVVEASDGTLLGARVAADGQWRFPPPDSLPDKYVTCVINYEDRHFRRHPGVNPVSLFRALVYNIRSGRIVSGGSTITMQVARMARGNPHRTYGGKVVEIFSALKLELFRSKEAIMLLYAANAPFGGNTVGIEAAAWRYTGRSPADLSWGESAMLAVLPNAPSLTWPGRASEQLRTKRNRLLTVLAERGVIDSVTCSLAMEEPLPAAPQPMPSLAPHLTTRLWQEAATEIPNHTKSGRRKAPTKGTTTKSTSPGRIAEEKAAAGKSSSGRTSTKRTTAKRTTAGATSAGVTRFHTTIDPYLQRNIVDLLNSHQRQLECNAIHNAAAIVVEVASGKVAAYVGNSTLPDSAGVHGRFVDMIMSPRSTGSIMKPFLYAGLLSSGMLLPNTLVPDIPTRFQGFRPENSDFSYSGAVPAGDALARSLNIPAVRMLQMYEPERLLVLLQRMGFTSFNRPASHYGLSLILGGGEASLWELTGAYSSMARVLTRERIDDDRRRGSSERIWHMPLLVTTGIPLSSSEGNSPATIQKRHATESHQSATIQKRNAAESHQPATIQRRHAAAFSLPATSSENHQPATIQKRHAAESHQSVAVETSPVAASLLPSSAAIWLTYEALRRVNRPESETGWQYLGGSAEVAWKTGTSYGFRDAWAIGTTPDYVIGVWAGNADGEGRPGLTGITAAAPLLFDIIRLLPRSRSWFSRPEEGMVLAEVCSASGYRAGPHCTERHHKWIPESGLSSVVCPYHTVITLDPTGRWRVNSSCATPGEMTAHSWFLLPPAMEYYYRMRHPSYQTLPPYRTGCNDDMTVPAMEFIYPSAGARIFIPRSLHGEKMSMITEIAHRRRDATIYWHLDDQFIGTTRHFHQTEIKAGSGEHLITAVDDQGITIRRKFYSIESM